MTDQTTTPATKPPFFVLGSQRSGTTMLRLMLNNHRNLVIPHETAFITLYFHKLADYGDLSDPANAARLLDDVAEHTLVQRGELIPDRQAVLDRPIRGYRDFVEAIFAAYADQFDKPRWGDKTPFYSEDVDVIRRVFPDCKIIHLVRDGRDVIVSQKSIEWMAGNLPRLVRDWRWKTMLLHKVGAVLGADFLEVRYEDLVISPDQVLRDICTFLGEPYDPDMLTYSDSAGDVVPTESLKWHRNSIRPPDPSKLGQWKSRLPKSERIIFEQIAGDALDLFGYEREHLEPTLASRARSLYYDVVKRN